MSTFAKLSPTHDDVRKVAPIVLKQLGAASRSELVAELASSLSQLPPVQEWADIADVLESPLCVGEAQELLLSSLREKRTLWDD